MTTSGSPTASPIRTFPWGFHGECFDGHRFNPDNVERERALMERFWVDFRKGCPDKEIQVRGTNFTVGMDIASDGADHNVPLEYRQHSLPPCNPPWALARFGNGDGFLLITHFKRNDRGHSVSLLPQ